MARLMSVSLIEKQVTRIQWRYLTAADTTEEVA
jgi:hypothetical protein